MSAYRNNEEPIEVFEPRLTLDKLLDHVATTLIFGIPTYLAITEGAYLVSIPFALITLLVIYTIAFALRHPNFVRVELHRTFIRFIDKREKSVFEVQRPLRAVAFGKGANNTEIVLVTDEGNIDLPPILKGHRPQKLIRFLEAAVEAKDET